MNFTPIEQTFTIKYDYKLHFTQGLFNQENSLFVDLIKAYKPNKKVKLLFVIDDGVKFHHPDLDSQIAAYCKKYDSQLQHTATIVVKGGESSKSNPAHVEEVIEAINENKICRHSFVIAIGGGALVDMAGYAATIAHRGVKLIRIPTTVLAQNDAAVGVKNSVNALNKKNFLGTFATPYAIINDSDFLLTLEFRDWISGIAEAVKVALIKDKSFFEEVENNASALCEREMEPMQHLIYRCAQLHMHHIAQGGDPFESGSSRPLDFGHWAAHKLEALTNYNVRHGEAVAIGMALDLTYAHLIGLIDESTLKRIIKVLEEVGFSLGIPLDSEMQYEELLNGIEEFREHLGGELTITLISEIGVKHDVHEIDYDKMRLAMSMLNEFSTNKLSV